MKKLYLLSTISLSILAVNVSSQGDESFAAVKDGYQPAIGGCGAPVFFTSYSQDEIKHLTQLQNTRHINISYPGNLKPLALKIYYQLKWRISNAVVINIEQVDLQDTSTVKYRHDAVVVQQCFN